MPLEEHFILLSAHLPNHDSSSAYFEAACSLVTEATMKQAKIAAVCWSGIRIVAGWDANLELKHLVGNLQEEEYEFLNTVGVQVSAPGALTQHQLDDDHIRWQAFQGMVMEIRQCLSSTFLGHRGYSEAVLNQA